MTITGDETKLPPELWRMIASHLDVKCIRRLVMSSSYLASALAFDVHRNWDIDCCKAADDKIHNQPSNFAYRTSLNSFFKALKCGLAPAFAERVVFDFCRHCEPIQKQTRERLLNKPDWPIGNALKLLRALDANEIVLSVWDGFSLYHTCNEPLFNVVLLESVKESSNATVRLRLLESVQKPGPNHFYRTISTPSMSRTVVAANVQSVVSGPTTLRVDGPTLWETVEFVSSHETTSSIHLNNFPSLTCFTQRCPITRDYLNELPRRYRHCHRLFVIARNPYHKPVLFRPGSIYYFRPVPDRSYEICCTEISVHMSLREWVDLLFSAFVLETVRILEIHHTDKSSERIAYPTFLMEFLSNVILHVPNLELMTFKVDYKLKDTAYCSPLIDGQVWTESFCEHCKRNTHTIEIDVMAVRDRLKRPPDHLIARGRMFGLIDKIRKK